MKTAKPELLRIDREAGVYWWRVDGRETPYPSVTHVLETVFRPFRRRAKHCAKHDEEYALQRGNAVHRAIALLEGFGDGSGLSGGVEGLDGRLKPYVDGWLEFKAKAEVKIVSCETPMLALDYDFAGTPDMIAVVYGKKAVIDIKSGGTAPLVWLQLAAYEWLALDGPEPTSLYALYLPGNGKFKLREPPDERPGHDLGVFLSALKCHRYMKERLNG